jgi:foldase protein PrsA
MIYLCNYKNLYGSEYGIDLWGYDFGDESLEDYVKDIALSELVRVTCMDLLAQEQEIALDESELKLVEKSAKKYVQSLSDDEIAFMGVKQSDVELAYEHYALAEKLYRTLTTGVEKEVSDDEARVMRIQQIYVTDEETADLVAEKLDSGEDFSAVAGTYNKASTIEICIARGDMPEEVEAVAFEMDDGDFSEKIPVDGGYYFIRCLNKYEEELTETNKDVIRERREKGQFDDAYAEFVASAVYELNEELWDGVTLEGMDDVITTDDFFQIYTDIF